MKQQIVLFCQIIKNVLRDERDEGVQENIEWDNMVRFAKEQNVYPLFVEEAVKYSTYITRLKSSQEMQEALMVVSSQVRRTETFLQLYKAFLEADIHPLVLKGLVCRGLYGKYCDHRPSGDEDILIQPAEYWKAKEVLLTNGYVTEIKDETEEQLENLQEVSFYHATEGLHIELHLNVMGREDMARSKMSDCFKNVFDDYREIEIDGMMIRTMSHQNHFLYLILHAFKHFMGSGFGIRQMLDILLYQENYGEQIDMQHLYQTLKEFRAAKFLSDIVSIGNRYFGFNLQTIQEANCPDELLEDMLSGGVFGGKTQAHIAAARVTTFATGDYLKTKSTNRFMIFWRAIFPDRAYLLRNAPQLETKPWLLPIEWVKRWGRFVKRSIHNDGDLVNESLSISQKRIELLKKYDLL